MEISRQLRNLKIDDMVTILQQIYLVLYAESQAGRVVFDPDKEWTPGALALVASILDGYGLKPSARHTVELAAGRRGAEEIGAVSDASSSLPTPTPPAPKKIAIQG